MDWTCGESVKTAENGGFCIEIDSDWQRLNFSGKIISMVDLVFKNNTSSRAHGRSFFVKILEIAAQELKLEDKVEVSVNLVGEDKIKELNHKYCHKNKPTDVLSFPMQEKLEIRNLKLAIPKSNASAFDLGDIFICLSIAKNEAKTENVSIENKLTQLGVHGFLHLLGYDHEKSEVEVRKMFMLERKILDRLDY